MDQWGQIGLASMTGGTSLLFTGFGKSKSKKYQRYAEMALENARRIQDYQSEVEFRRQMLSNIRQERIARAQLTQGNYSTTARTSSQQGALANIDSSLAGETYFSYASSDRAKQAQNYIEQAEYWNRKAGKATQKRAMAFSLAGTVAGGAIGALAGGPAGAVMGAQIGQGFGQIVAKTGDKATLTGVQNILSGGMGIWSMNQIEDNYQKYLQMIRMNRYELASVDPQSNQIIPGSQVYAGNYSILSNIRGYRP